MAPVTTAVFAFFSLTGNTLAEGGSETFFLFDNAVVEQAAPMVFFGAEIGLLPPPVLGLVVTPLAANLGGTTIAIMDLKEKTLGAHNLTSFNHRKDRLP
jgi:hypothetical protein